MELSTEEDIGVGELVKITEALIGTEATKKLFKRQLKFMKSLPIVEEEIYIDLERQVNEIFPKGFLNPKTGRLDVSVLSYPEENHIATTSTILEFLENNEDLQYKDITHIIVPASQGMNRVAEGVAAYSGKPLTIHEEPSFPSFYGKMRSVIGDKIKKDDNLLIMLGGLDYTALNNLIEIFFYLNLNFGMRVHDSKKSQVRYTKKYRAEETEFGRIVVLPLVSLLHPKTVHEEIIKSYKLSISKPRLEIYPIVDVRKFI